MIATGGPTGTALGLAAAATLAGISTAVVACLPRRPTLASWLGHRKRAGLRPIRAHVDGRRPARSRSTWGWRLRGWPASIARSLASWWARRVRQAGIESRPSEVLGGLAGLTAAVTACLLLLARTGILTLPPPIVAGIAAGVPLVGAAEIVQRGQRRRRSVLLQLPILADLVVLEQTGGGIGLRHALEEVVTRVGGVASDALLGCLTQSALTGADHLDESMDRVALELALPALASLATVARLQRTEGAAVAPLLRQLASTLRDQQRDALLAAGKRAVVQMLIPTGLCILLPFIVLVLYPAVARLMGTLA